jgi:hypothetical protein
MQNMHTARGTVGQLPRKSVRQDTWTVEIEVSIAFFIYPACPEPAITVKVDQVPEAGNTCNIRPRRKKGFDQGFGADTSERSDLFQTLNIDAMNMAERR